jgi:hypothetical protein
VGGFVEAQPNNPPRAFGVRRLCRRLSAVSATTQTRHAGGVPQFFVCATLAFGRHPEERSDEGSLFDFHFSPKSQITA